MVQFSNFQERDAFAVDVFEFIQEYLNDGSLDNNFCLCIHPKTLKFDFFMYDDKPKGWDFYPVAKLIRPNENNTGVEPDYDATHELASSYCFVR